MQLLSRNLAQMRQTRQTRQLHAQRAYLELRGDAHSLDLLGSPKA